MYAMCTQTVLILYREAEVDQSGPPAEMPKARAHVSLMFVVIHTTMALYYTCGSIG